MAPARFGTDGVRGVANEELTAELALALGRATARVLPAPTFVVGRDTRRSGPLLQAAFSAGLAAEGADVVDLGVLPTPGVAAVAERRKVPGAVISASHNPFGDNGIKLFSLLGTKLPDGGRGRDRTRTRLPPRRPRSAASATDGPWGGADHERPRSGRAVQRTAHLQRLRAGASTGCASLSTAPTAPPARSRRGCSTELGASVTAHRTTTPTAPTSTRRAARPTRRVLSLAVVAHRADLGLAFDGDADRVIAVDHTGAHRRRRRAAGPVRARPGRAGTPGREHRRCDGDDEPRLPPGHGGPRHRGARDRRRGPPRPGGARRRRADPRRRAIGPHRVPATATTGDGVLTGIAAGRSGDALGPFAGRPGGRLVERLPQLLSTCPSPTRRWPTRRGRGGGGERRRDSATRPGAPAGERHRAPRPGHGGGARTRPRPMA